MQLQIPTSPRHPEDPRQNAGNNYTQVHISVAEVNETAACIPPQPCPSITLPFFLRSLRAYDFSSASAVLIPSVPGKHSGKNLYKYGHMRVRAVLEREEVHVRPNKHRVLFQPASIMSLSIKPVRQVVVITAIFSRSGVCVEYICNYVYVCMSLCSRVKNSEP